MSWASYVPVQPQPREVECGYTTGFGNLSKSNARIWAYLTVMQGLQAVTFHTT